MTKYDVRKHDIGKAVWEGLLRDTEHKKYL